MSQLRLLDGPGDGPRVFTVSQVVRGANRVLEQRFASIWVEGEVSNLKVVSNGHAFFSLVDDGAVLPTAMWRSAVQRLRFRIENGQTLRVQGRLGIYDRQGRFQLYGERAEPAGLGALMLQLQQLRERLAAEGLLDPERKRPLPRAPRRIGVVTSATGAAIHDVLEVARRRCPSRILLGPAQVQGDGAAPSLIRALERLARADEVDVIILGRGGGSAEDLWAFNDEGLARAVAACPVPVVSAVGHDVDVTACDWVADVRAATPSHAAELVVPDAREWSRGLEERTRRLRREMERRVGDTASHLESLVRRLSNTGADLVEQPRTRLLDLQRRLAPHHPRVRIEHQQRRLATAGGRLSAFGRGATRPARLRLARLAGALDALSPLAVLDRGYSVVARPDGSVVADAASLKPGEDLELRFARGRAGARVTAVYEGEGEGD